MIEVRFLKGMMNMKKKIIIAITLVLIAFGAYRGTMAIFHQETNVNAPITAGKLGIDIINSSTNEVTDTISFENVIPGAIIEDPVKIRNTKDKELYVRITLTRYWVDEHGKKITDANANYITPITKNTQDWICMKDDHSNNEILYFYHQAPVLSNKETSNFLDQIAFDTDITSERYEGYSATVVLEAEALQSVGAKDAMLSSWGMEVTIDKNGNIIEVKE